MGKKVAVVLAGCGVQDGSEIHEAVFLLNQLSKSGAEYKCYAPDINQMHVVDHTKSAPADGQSRNVLQEAARIARGVIAPLTELKGGDHDVLMFPGGFGAAKNLCDCAVKGPDMTVIPEVERVIKEFHGASKPIGLCCIAPVLAAKVIGNGVEVTLGQETESADWPYAGTCGAVRAFGATHVPKQLNEACVDEKNKIVTSPAYMQNTAPMHQIEESVVLMVNKTLALA